MSHDTDELREIEALCRRILTDTAGADHQNAPALDRETWAGLESAGLTDLASGFEGDAPGAGLRRVVAVLREAGRHTNAIPIAENDLLTWWVAQRAGLKLSSGVLHTVALLDDRGAGAVSWLGEVDVVLAIAPTPAGGSAVWVAAASSATTGVPSPADAESLQSVRMAVPEDAVVLDEDIRSEITLIGGLARTVMMTGAAERVVEIVVEHVTTREQFGRPISKFQAVQHLVADLSSEASLMAATADAAVGAAAEHGISHPSTQFAIAAAASCVGHSVSPVVRNAHQLLGAMGYTREHQLRIFTSRLVRWRSEFGALRSWDERVLRAAQEAGTEGLWPLVAG